jgi:GntR family transcriptional regulator/MocR family aminotransferase
MPELRTAPRGYLNRVRGTARDPGDVVIARLRPGPRARARALAGRGARVVAVEDPSDPEYRATVEAAGLSWVAVPVDDDGLRVDRLAATGADAVVVTAAHQYPTGAVLTPERRAALVDWAEPGTRRSSRTTTTPSSATTASRSARSRASARTT